MPKPDNRRICVAESQQETALLKQALVFILSTYFVMAIKHYKYADFSRYITTVLYKTGFICGFCSYRYNTTINGIQYLILFQNFMRASQQNCSVNISKSCGSGKQKYSRFLLETKFEDIPTTLKRIRVFNFSISRSKQ